MTLLTALNDVQRLCSLPVTSAIVADAQETQNLLFALAKREARELSRRHEWPELRRTQSFTASLASLQSAPGKPADFDRMVKKTFWNRTLDQEVCGPLTDEEWGIAYGRPFTSAIQQYWMLRHDGLHIFPVPTAADTLAFDYIINTPVESSGGTAQTTWQADTDVFKLDEELLVLGVTWRFFKQKGLDYAEAMKDYELRVAAAIGASRSARDIMLASVEFDPIGEPMIPETGYGA